MPNTTPSTLPQIPDRRAVFRLHWWNSVDDETALFATFDAALASLARTVRDDWDAVTWRGDALASPDDLTDTEAVLAFYGGNGGAGGRAAPTSGESFGSGFEIVEDLVGGPEPAAVSLRLATLRVLETASDDPGVAAVTYRLEAAGLTVSISPDADGYPVVLITPDAELTDLPVTVRVRDPLLPNGVEHVLRVS